MRFHQSFSVVSCCFFTRGSISYLSFTCFSAVSFSQGCTIGLKKLLHILFCYLALYGFHFGDQILHPQSGGDHPNDPIIVVVTTSITTTSTFFSNFHGKILVRPNLKGMSSLHSFWSPTTRLHIVRFPPPALKFTYHPEFNNDDPRLTLTFFAMSIPQTRVHLRNTGEWPHVGFMAFPMVNPCESHRWGRISTWGSRAGSHGQGAAAQRGVAPKPTIVLGRGLRKSPILRFGLWMFMLPKKSKKDMGMNLNQQNITFGGPTLYISSLEEKTYSWGTV